MVIAWSNANDLVLGQLKTKEKSGVNWQLSIEKERHKLKSIYPKIEC
jgi:hypothetical protein